MTRHFLGDSDHHGIGFVDQRSSVCTDYSHGNRSLRLHGRQTQLSAGTYEISTLGHAAGIEIRNTKAGKSVLSVVRSEHSRNDDSGAKLVFNRYAISISFLRFREDRTEAYRSFLLQNLKRKIQIARSGASRKVVVAAK